MFPGCSDKHLILCHRLAPSLVSAGALRSGGLYRHPLASPSQKIFHHISCHSLCICLFRNVRRAILFQQLFDAAFTPCAVNGSDEQSNAAIKAALELYAADHGKLNDGDSFTTKLNNCVLTISLKDGSLDVQFDPDADVAVDTPYTLDMKLDIYKEEDNG